MAMTCKFYQVTDENNKLDKTLGTYKVNTTVTLKESTSLVNPTFIITGFNMSSYPVNYVELTLSTSATKYYFIKDMIAVANNVWELPCHIDVLMSYNSEIKNLMVTIERQENLYNLYLNDSIIKKFSYPLIQTKAFSGTFGNSYQYYLIASGG